MSDSDENMSGFKLSVQYADVLPVDDCKPWNMSRVFTSSILYPGF